MSKIGVKRRPVIDKTKHEVNQKPFEFNDGQERVLKLLNSPTGKQINELLIAAGSRCFTGETLVQTDRGHVPIKNIKRGDRVLSTDLETGLQEFQKTTSNNRSEQVRDMLEIVLGDGTTIHCAWEHEFMLGGKFREIGPALIDYVNNNAQDYENDQGVWYKKTKPQLRAVYYTRYTDGLELNLAGRELHLSEVFAIRPYTEQVELWDLSVEKNSNFCVTEHNLIVHNSGKTFLIVAIICTMSLKYPGSRHLIARKHFSHVKGAVWLDTLPKVIDLLYPELKPHLYWNATDFFLQFPNGSEIWMGGLDDKERVDKILGREYMNIFFNEASEIDYTTYVKVKTRLAQLVPGGKNRIFVDENPPSSKHWTKVLFVDRVDPEKKLPVKNPQKYAFVQIHPWENKENISPEYLEMIENLPANERLRFFEGKFRDDAKFALWKSETINAHRVYEHPPLRRIVVAVDPAVTAKDESDETGIVVMGVGFNRHIYTLADYTGTYTPTEWANKAVDAYELWKADEIVAEVNNGGDLVETVVRQVNDYVNYTGVHATRNKLTRAEPVAALMEQGVDHHVGEFPELEEEMTTWEGKNGQASPNRIDAKVWGAFALIPELSAYNKKTGGTFAAAMKMGMRLR